MAVILQNSLHLLMILKVIGELYLLWLAFLSVRSTCLPGPENTVVKSEQSWFLQGLLLNMSNPKAVIAWMAALSVGLGSNDGIYSVVAATFVCIVIGFIVYALYCFLLEV